jgi:hypothetical protein
MSVADRRQQQWRQTMNIVKLALLASLRIAFFGALKAALFAYTLYPLRRGLCQRTRPKAMNIKLSALASSAGPSVQGCRQQI